MKRARTLLVHMPWGSLQELPLGVAALKAYLRAAGRGCDVIYPSLLWARQIGLAEYRRLQGADFYADWFFAYSVFGPRGTREIPGRWEELLPRIREYGADERSQWLATARPSDIRRFATREVPRFLESCLRRYPWHEYDIIGFSTLYMQDLASLALSRLLKRRYPDKLIVLGGANVAGEMGLERLRAFPWIDVVVGGEGERALLGLVQAVEQGGPDGPLPGVHRRDRDRIISGLPAEPVVPDDLPFVDHSDYFRALTDHGLSWLITPQLTVEVSRGCRWGEKKRCLFCSLREARYRTKSATRLIKELRWVTSRHKNNNLSVWSASADKKMLSGLLPRLNRQKLDLRLRTFIRADLGGVEIRRLGDAGFTFVHCGIEALSTTSLKLIGKGTRAIQNFQMLKHAKECGIEVGWTFLYGIPGQASKADTENLAAACLISHLQPSVSPNPVRIERFSPYFEHARDFGIKNLRPKWIYRFLFPAHSVDLSRLAFQFDYDAPLTDYRTDLERVVLAWQQSYAQGGTFLFQERLPGLLKVYDRRLRSHRDVRPTFRLHLLRGLEAALCQFCGSMRSESELLAFAAQRAGGSPQAARHSLQRLKAAGLLFHEGRHYLGLALPAKAYPRSLREKAYAMALQAGLTRR